MTVNEPAELLLANFDIHIKELEIKTSFHILNKTRRNMRKAKELHLAQAKSIMNVGSLMQKIYSLDRTKIKLKDGNINNAAETLD